MAEDNIISVAEQNVNTTNVCDLDQPQYSQYKSNAQIHNSTPIESRVTENSEDDSTMTDIMSEAEPPARSDKPAPVPWLGGEVLDQAKGPPPPDSGLGGTTIRRRDYENLRKYNGEAKDDSSKA